jgi:alcohol dehydrogenase
VLETWQFHNPVRITFGAGSLARLGDLLSGRSYALVTYGEAPFDAFADRVAELAGPPAVLINNVATSPDFETLRACSDRFAAFVPAPEVIVALGGGSVIDAAKVFSASPGDFAPVERHLLGAGGTEDFAFLPLIALPTTAGTGSEVTSWASVWDGKAGKKYSLAHPRLLPEQALIDPELMVAMPRGLTINTGLDALSHALEAIWNRNANPISSDLAVAAALDIIATLPKLADDLNSRPLRRRMAKAALIAGLAFSNTKTALAHSLSYPITLQHGLPHGLACSFSLPMILESIIGQDAASDAALKRIFGADLVAGAAMLAAFLTGLGVSVSAADHGIDREDFRGLIAAAFDGERGRNFIGEEEKVLAAEAMQYGP